MVNILCLHDKFEDNKEVIRSSQPKDRQSNAPPPTSIEERILELQKKKLQLKQGIYKGGKTDKVLGKELLKLLKA